MSVLIKGMKMPRYCAECDAVDREELLCPFTNDDCEDYFSVRNRNCPIEFVPPHGRLGDLDELAKRIEHDRYHHTHTDGLAARHHIAEYGHFLNAIAAAPTIIPAELPVLHGTFAATSEKEALKRIALAEEGKA